jgi:hypothetical protein
MAFLFILTPSDYDDVSIESTVVPRIGERVDIQVKGGKYFESEELIVTRVVHFLSDGIVHITVNCPEQ